jgi:antitoxin (DNA-binding transcriptional repressor) of toxin-antitoxin stability system
MSEVVNVHKAKTQLSKLLERTERGERIIIARGHEPIAELRSLKRTRVIGRQKGLGVVPPDFCNTDDQTLALFGLA